MATSTTTQRIELPHWLKGAEGIFFVLFVAAISELLLKDLPDTGAVLAYFSKVGRISLVFIALYVIHRFATVSLSSYHPGLKDGMWMTLIVSGSVMLVWLARIMTIGLASYPGTESLLGPVSPSTFLCALPYTAGALLIQAIFGLHYGLVYSAALSIIVGVYFPNAPGLSAFVLVTTLVATLSLSRFRARSAYLRAGLNAALAGALLALALGLIGAETGTAELTIRVVGALVGGILAAFIAAGVTPLVEYFGGYVTDMRLIEMATLDHALLKELSIQAPGTWNHSMVMGMMVEAGAEAIDANAVVCRVGAYFHDVGKIKKPLYFVENQPAGENRHDKLSPSMSALIIRSHVKEGIELARKHGLPKVIEDMIPQHHGTNRIEYFFDKARKEAEEEGRDEDSIDENLYRYPGPKPQSREAGLLMLADGIEAAARTLSEPTLDRIQGLVQKQMNKIFASGELEESDLTLRDLHLIAKAFTRILNGIYHQRIAYAEPAEKTSTDEPEASSAPVDGGGEVAPGDSSESKEDRGAGSEDLKRLGLS